MTITTSFGCYADTLPARLKERLSDHLAEVLELANPTPFGFHTSLDLVHEADDYKFGTWTTEIDA